MTKPPGPAYGICRLRWGRSRLESQLYPRVISSLDSAKARLIGSRKLRLGQPPSVRKTNDIFVGGSVGVPVWVGLDWIFECFKTGTHAHFYHTGALDHY